MTSIAIRIIRQVLNDKRSLALIVVALFYAFRKRDLAPLEPAEPQAFAETTGQIIRNLLVIAIPVTIGAAIMPIMGIVDASLIKSTLIDIGLDQ